MPIEYTDEFHSLTQTCALDASLSHFKTFMFGKPEEINFDHNINFGDYSTAWTGTAASNENAHDLCLITYPRTEIVDLYKQTQIWQFDLYACRLIADSYVKTFTKEQNFAGLDLKIWKMLLALNSCTNRVIDSSVVRDFGLFNDKLMVVRASVQWELNSVCTPTTIAEEIEECVD